MIFTQRSGAHLVLKGSYGQKQLFHGRDISMFSIRDIEKGKDQLDLSGLS